VRFCNATMTATSSDRDSNKKPESNILDENYGSQPTRSIVRSALKHQRLDGRGHCFHLSVHPLRLSRADADRRVSGLHPFVSPVECFLQMLCSRRNTTPSTFLVPNHNFFFKKKALVRQCGNAIMPVPRRFCAGNKISSPPSTLAGRSEKGW